MQKEKRLTQFWKKVNLAPPAMVGASRVDARVAMHALADVFRLGQKARKIRANTTWRLLRWLDSDSREYDFVFGGTVQTEG